LSLIPQSQLFNDILPAAVIIAVDGRVEEANQAALNLLEAQDLSELTGRELSDFVHPLDQPRSQARVRREGESFVNPAAKFRIRTVKGAYRMVLLSSRAFQHEGRDALMVSGLDMTDHEALDAQMRESEHNFRRLFTNMQDVYYRTDVRGMLVQVSPSVEAMLGYSAEELKGEDVRRFYTEDTDSEAYVQRI
jgi:PAS domain S-box-containing protein